MSNITIHPATHDEITAIVNFITKARADMFPFLDQTSSDQMALKELDIFKDRYLDHPQGAFLTVCSEGRLIATIGYVAYDGRFSHLSLEPENVVEVLRLYVEPEWRRAGIASKLFDTLVETARQSGVEQLYLHTHPFLPNAIDFWKGKGFSVITVDEDPVWQTTHMKRSL
ncbi:GNAT family acetyltransferase [Fusarium tjaetaba]|uniref:GNAT family acetyltransferase n=1 Tax=Fusarium tjaetaba TaxID=1567544 RepID=A0A8H5QZN8_9HYPO|nr:GNAT family acetyltransferase [Fusarium tjaetaba]KAF5624084.1 GNAT family acetyltransferase [Fusarium tjaetaba]